jgi:hypothetical protein
MATGGGGGGSIPTAAPPAPHTSCTTGLFQIEVSSGPSFVSCNPTATNPSGQCTEIEYKVVAGGKPDHVAAVEGVGVQYVTGPGNQWYPPCVGDPVTDVGEKSCHEQAAKFNPTYSVLKFKIGLAGQRSSSPTTVATKKGYNVGTCRILGIGLETAASQFQSTQKTETVNFKGCAVTFVRDVSTGAVVSAELNTEESTKPACSASGADPEDCCSDVITSNIDKLSLTLDVPGVGELGAGQIGEGYISSGTNSCTTRVLGGRVYTWGSPCP